MPFLSPSPKPQLQLRFDGLADPGTFRYEIEGDAPAWEQAEKQVRSAAREGKANPVVSVKSGKQKRKSGPTANEIYEEAFGDKSHKKAKKSRRDR